MSHQGTRTAPEWINGIGMRLCWCPPGAFLMGSPAGELGRRDHEAQAYVEITRGFWMGKYPVTQGEFATVTRTNPSFVQGNTNLPVEHLSWDEAIGFCGALTERERAQNTLPGNVIYRLPTEAQWEYACRAGTTAALNSGKGLATTGGICRTLGELGWYDGNSHGKTHPVGAKAANLWGLHDMHGNVWEWCADWYAEQLEGGRDPWGPPAGSDRVIRGGSWSDRPEDCRSASRGGLEPSCRMGQLGFRIVIGPAW